MEYSEKQKQLSKILDNLLTQYTLMQFKSDPSRVRTESLFYETGKNLYIDLYVKDYMLCKKQLPINYV